MEDIENMEKKEREAFRKACEGIEKGTPFSGIDFVNEKCKDCGHQGIYRSMKGNFGVLLIPNNTEYCPACKSMRIPKRKATLISSLYTASERRKPKQQKGGDCFARLVWRIRLAGSAYIDAIGGR